MEGPKNISSIDSVTDLYIVRMMPWPGKAEEVGYLVVSSGSADGEFAGEERSQFFALAYKPNRDEVL
jgi:hypothetical protein